MTPNSQRRSDDDRAVVDRDRGGMVRKPGTYGFSTRSWMASRVEEADLPAAMRRGHGPLVPVETASELKDLLEPGRVSSAGARPLFALRNALTGPEECAATRWPVLGVALPREKAAGGGTRRCISLTKFFPCNRAFTGKADAPNQNGGLPSGPRRCPWKVRAFKSIKSIVRKSTLTDTWEAGPTSWGT